MSWGKHIFVQICADSCIWVQISSMGQPDHPPSSKALWRAGGATRRQDHGLKLGKRVSGPDRFGWARIGADSLGWTAVGSAAIRSYPRLPGCAVRSYPNLSE